MLLPEGLLRRRELRRLRRVGRVVMGTATYGVPTVVDFAHDDRTCLRIGSYTSIAGGVTFLLGGNHPTDRITTYPLRSRLGLPGAGDDGFPCSKGDIVVGSDVWLGHGVTVVSGVRIGHGAVVAAGALVTRDVPDYAVVAGSPVTVLRHRFDETTVARLLAVAWWDWPVERVAANADLLSGTDVHELLEKVFT